MLGIAPKATEQKLTVDFNHKSVVPKLRHLVTERSGVVTAAVQ